MANLFLGYLFPWLTYSLANLFLGYYFLVYILFYYWACICRAFKETRNRFPARRAGTKPYLSYWPARLHRLAKSIPQNRFLASISIYKYGLCLSACASLTILCFAILLDVFLVLRNSFFLCNPLPLLPLSLHSSSLPIFLQYFNYPMPLTIVRLPCEQFSLPLKNSSLFILVL